MANPDSGFLRSVAWWERTLLFTIRGYVRRVSEQHGSLANTAALDKWVQADIKSLIRSVYGCSPEGRGVALDEHVEGPPRQDAASLSLARKALEAAITDEIGITNSGAEFFKDLIDALIKEAKGEPLLIDVNQQQHFQTCAFYRQNGDNSYQTCSYCDSMNTSKEFA